MKLKFVSKNKPTKLWAPFPFKAWWIGGSQLETLPQSSHTIHGCRVCFNKIPKTLLPYLSYCTLPKFTISLPLPTAVSYNTPKSPKSSCTSSSADTLTSSSIQGTCACVIGPQMSFDQGTFREYQSVQGNLFEVYSWCYMYEIFICVWLIFRENCICNSCNYSIHEFDSSART